MRLEGMMGYEDVGLLDWLLSEEIEGSRPGSKYHPFPEGLMIFILL
jgi:hypothetical protein